MSKVDKVKEEIGWLKVIFALLIATEISLIAWLVQNYSATEKLSVIGCIVAIIVITLALVILNRMAYKKIDSLEDM